jgi:hypothetical protein
MADISLTVAKLVLVALSLVLMATAVTSFLAGQAQAGTLFLLLAVGVVVLFTVLG